MSYPTRLKLFKAWAKAMEMGATVDKPNYSKKSWLGKKTPTRRRSNRFRRKRKQQE